jgi:phenylacetate-CoA ligase
MYSKIVRHILYPLADVFQGTRMLKYLDEFERTQWWDIERLRELQNEKLRALVMHAYQNVPYYRRIFEERGLIGGDIQTVEDLNRLPILTKDIIWRNFNDMTAKGVNKWKPLLNATSGSTGEPLKYYIDMEVASVSWAGMFRGWQWAGYKLGDKRATLAGASLVPDKSPSLINRLRWLVENNRPFSAVHLDKKRMAEYARKIACYKPKFLRGYPSALFTFAQYLEQEGIDNIRPEAVFTTAEMLLPQHRSAIKQQFGCDVFDQYGCYDGGPQAMECAEHLGYHISTEKVIMEFVDKDKKPVPVGCSGEILATDLCNYTMPFIRYAVGDRGTLSGDQCSCGRGLPLMKSLEGRTTDILSFDNGITLSGPALTLVFKDCHIKQYQVIQEAGDRLLIKVVKGVGYTDRDTNHFLRIIQSHIGENISITTEFVEEIPTDKAGKYKFIISKFLPKRST